MPQNTTPAPTLESLDALANWLTSAPVRVDCFFVTLGTMLGTTVDDIARRIGTPVPQPGSSSGVSVRQIIDGLTSLGLVFRVWMYQPEPPSGGGPIRGTRGPITAGIPEPLAHAAPGMPRVVGAAYRRPDRSGHVVICRMPPHRSPGTPYRRYVDYQGSPSGRDVTRDAQNSQICVLFGIDRDASRGEFYQRHRQQIERMEVEEAQAHPEGEPMEVDQDKPNSSDFWGGRFHDEL
ncbi:hypothetical protein C8Q74DRAFT_717457 [Fomes fomentarius]|nr:hypothetical protein C8Q74DRAFT_717457 [Fomes fomentarius]